MNEFPFFAYFTETKRNLLLRQLAHFTLSDMPTFGTIQSSSEPKLSRLDAGLNLLRHTASEQEYFGGRQARRCAARGA